MNEDAFLFDGRLRPTEIKSRESDQGRFSGRGALFAVASGFGGSGRGDLAARMALLEVRDALAPYADAPVPDFDFSTLAEDLVQRIDDRIENELGRGGTVNVGSSLALLYVQGQVAYTLGVGAAGILLHRDGAMHRPTVPLFDEDDSPFSALGCSLRGAPERLRIGSIRLEAGDLFLIVGEGYCRSLDPPQLLRAVDASQAFLARAEGAFNSVDDDRLGRTLVAVEVVDLGEEEMTKVPAAAEHDAFRRPSAGQGRSLAGQVPNTEEIASIRAAVYDEEAAYVRSAPGVRRALPPQPEKRRSGAGLFGTFIKSLLLGFLIGLAVLLTVWFLFL